MIENKTEEIKAVTAATVTPKKKPEESAKWEPWRETISKSIDWQKFVATTVNGHDCCTVHANRGLIAGGRIDELLAECIRYEKALMKTKAGSKKTKICFKNTAYLEKHVDGMRQKGFVFLVAPGETPESYYIQMVDKNSNLQTFSRSNIANSCK